VADRARHGDAPEFRADALGFIDLSATLQLSNRYSILGGIVGGLLFGYGMAQAGNCGYGVLARLGGGDIRALMIAIVMGVTASAAIFGVLGGLRPAFFPMDTRRHRALRPRPCIEGMTGLSHTPSASRSVRSRSACRSASSRRANASAASAGASSQASPSVRASSAPTGSPARLRRLARRVPQLHRAYRGDDPLRDVLLRPRAEIRHGLRPRVILGGAIGSFIQDGFRWEACEDPRELRRQMGGAVAMGLGAVLAAGCSVGQGLSALSLLSTTAPIVAASIWIGAWIGLRHLIFGLEAA
jgi:uncharacterized membrane protein YedE/YeeE